MHILECYLEMGGFDFRLLKGGISNYIWNLAKEMRRSGHRVSILTAAHGQVPYLESRYSLERVGEVDRYRLPLRLDPARWAGFPSEVAIDLETQAYRLSLEEIDVYVLANAYLDLFPDTFYPDYDTKGRDLAFYKPLVFQVDAIRFIRRHFAGEPLVAHLHEPYYHYLMPAALRGRPDTIIASVVQSNMPIAKKVYRPKVERLFDFLGVAVDLEPHMDTPAAADDVARCMDEHLARTHLHYPYGSDNLNLYSLVADHSHLIDFLSPGQERFYATFRDTPFEARFAQLAVSRTVRRNAHKHFIGWCAIGEHWLNADSAGIDRDRVLAGLGLDPALTTFYHNARYAVHHKGQRELMMAIDRLLSERRDANFIVRCISGSGIDDPYFHEVKTRYPGNIYLDWGKVPEATLIAYASAADFCLFPSKFEMDTFLIAQGEAMACGAVPIATAQEGMDHFLHARAETDPERTGFSLGRSFQEDDPLLVDAIAARVREAIALRRDNPDGYRRLSAQARSTARRFTWTLVADAHLRAFAGAAHGHSPATREDAAVRHGWLDELDDAALGRWRDSAIEAALRTGDHRTYRRCAEPDAEARRRLIDAACGRADLQRCAELAELFDEAALRRRLAERCQVVPRPTGADILYRFPDVAQVDLLIAGRDRAGAVRRVPLHAEGDIFRARMDDLPAPAELCFLLTLRNGRVTWDKVRHA